jgi:hypothetical protein
VTKEILFEDQNKRISIVKDVNSNRLNVLSGEDRIKVKFENEEEPYTYFKEVEGDRIIVGCKTDSSHKCSAIFRIFNDWLECKKELNPRFKTQWLGDLRV